MNEAVGNLCRKTVPVREGRYLLGFSGGADSVALLMMLVQDVRNGKICLEAVHVNHGLRGQESDEDERFCRNLCAETSIPITVYRANLHGRTDESSAREARYAFFRKRYTEYGADGLILAHHADDQAETFLMKLLRGAGPDGLECMKEDETVNGLRILRPMLSLGRREIRSALGADGLQWREDSSNADTAYLRNRIRTDLLPVMDSISGSAAEKICGAARLIARDNEALNEQAELLLKQTANGRLIDAEALAEEPEALRSRVLRMWWRTWAPGLKENTLSAARTEEMDGLLRVRRGKINLPGDLYAIRDGKYLFLRSNQEETPDPVPVNGPDTVFGSFRLTESVSEGEPGDGKRTQEVPPGFTRDCVIRTRMPGDRIRPFGSSGSRKLQDYLTDRKIAEPFRDQIPLLCRGEEVLLAGGVGAGNIPVWDRSFSPVRLTWHGDMPWME